MKNNIKILVLDDEPTVGERLKDYLERKGLEVEEFTDSTLALERLKQCTFEVVITDLKMKQNSGIDILRFIHENLPSTQAILITAYGQIEQFHEALALNAFEIVHKPFQLSEIYKIVLKAAKQSLL